MGLLNAQAFPVVSVRERKKAVENIKEVISLYIEHLKGR